MLLVNDDTTIAWFSKTEKEQIELSQIPHPNIPSFFLDF